jgi:hypothetical protein
LRIFNGTRPPKLARAQNRPAASRLRPLTREGHVDQNDANKGGCNADDSQTRLIVNSEHVLIDVLGVPWNNDHADLIAITNPYR